MTIAKGTAVSTPGWSDMLTQDRRKTARFYAWFGITESQFRAYVPVGSAGEITQKVLDRIRAQTSSPRAPFS